MAHRRWVVRHLSNGLAPCVAFTLIAVTNLTTSGSDLSSGPRDSRGSVVVMLLILPVTIAIGELFVAHRYWEVGMPTPEPVDLAAVARAKVLEEEQARLAESRQRSLRSATKRSVTL